MTLALVIFAAACVPSMLLALRPAVQEKSVGRFFIALIISFLVVVLPLFFFFLSSLLIPSWKGECSHGWLDCLIVGKVALAPLALVASAALYAVEVLRVKNRTRQAIVKCPCGTTLQTHTAP